jgi:hypothetical protein
VAAMLLANGGAWAQQSDPSDTAAVESEVATQTRPAVLYVETPLLLQPDAEPQLALPFQPSNPEDDPEFGARMASIDLYSNSVTELESGNGVWDVGLVELLASLANLQQQQGQHLEAINSFDRAIHVNRINSGLHTAEQIPLIEGLIESHMAVGDWGKTDLFYNYLFYVHQKAYGLDDPRMISELGRLGDWNIQAFNIGYGDALGVRLGAAQMLFVAGARMVLKHFGKNDERFVDFLLSIANSAYLVSLNPDLAVEASQSRYVEDLERLRLSLNQRGGSRPRGFNAGKDALTEIATYYSTAPDSTYEFAEAVTNLGDWHLMFRYRQAAATNYQEAWDLLSQQENGAELIQQLFGQVKSLPTFASEIGELVARNAALNDGAELNFDSADFAFDVTENGMVRDIRLLSEETDANRSQLLQVRRVLRDSVFRPVLKDGKRIRSDNLQFRFRYWY